MVGTDVENFSNSTFENSPICYYFYRNIVVVISSELHRIPTEKVAFYRHRENFKIPFPVQILLKLPPSRAKNSHIPCTVKWYAPPHYHLR